MGFYGYRSDWSIWLPFLGVWLIALLIRRSVQPLRTLLAGFWKDWTLLSFGIYILYSWVYILYDENHHPYLLLFIAAASLVTALGAWGYFRSALPLRRVLALLGGLLVSIVLNGINMATWDYRSYYGLAGDNPDINLVGVIFFAILVVIMFVNGLLAMWRLSRAKQFRH